MSIHLTDAQVQRILHLARTKATVQQIAQRIGCSENTVRNVCRRHGVELVGKRFTYTDRKRA